MCSILTTLFLALGLFAFAPTALVRGVQLTAAQTSTAGNPNGRCGSTQIQASIIAPVRGGTEPQSKASIWRKSRHKIRGIVQHMVPPVGSWSLAGALTRQVSVNTFVMPID